MKHRIVCITLSILVIVIFHLPSFSYEEPHYRFWTAEDGLAQTPTMLVNIGPQGKIIASGRQVFYHSFLDGYQVKKIPSPYGFAFFQQDEEGMIWSYLADSKEKIQPYILGFQRFNPCKNEWEKFPLSFFSDKINNDKKPILTNDYGLAGFDRFLYHSSGQIIFSHYDKVYSFQPPTMMLDSILSATETSMNIKYDWPIDNISDHLFGYNNLLGNVYKAHDGGIWISVVGGVIHGRWDETVASNKWTWKEFPFSDNLLNKTYFFHHIVERADGALFGKAYSKDDEGIMGTCILQYHDNRWSKVIDQELNNPCYGWKDTQNRLWFSDTSQTYIKSGTKVTPTFPTKFLDIAFESENSFFAASNLGLVRYAMPLWSTPDALQEIDNIVYGIAEDQNGTLWIANFDRLISYGNNEAIIYKTSSESINALNQIVDVIVLPNNQIAVELYTNKRGIFLFDQTSERFSPLLHPSGITLWNMILRHQKYWIISMNDQYKHDNIFLYDGKNFTSPIELGNLEKKLEGLVFNDIAVASNGDIWIGLLNPHGPLCYKQSGEVILYDDLKTFPGTGSSKVLKVGENKIWCAGGNEVCEFDGKTWQVVKTKTDLVNDMIMDSHGRIWLATYNGIHCYDSNQYNSWIHYTTKDGLPIKTVVKLFEDSQGTIWAGTEEGISRFNPNADLSPPKVWMTEEKNSKKIAPDGDAQFIFHGIDKWKQTQQDRLYYSYRVDNEDWSEFVSDNVAVINKIPPGIHTFQVRAMDLNWNISEEPTNWEFIVDYPWYKKNEVISIISLSLLLTFFFAGIAIRRHLQLARSNNLLNLANQELRELDQMKSAFVSQASHDLRTPLTAIKSSLDNLRRGVGGGINEKQDKVLDRALRSVSRLTDLVNDILDLNRIESGRIVLEKSETSFDALVQNVIHENQPAADHKRITLSAHGIDETCLLHIDAGKIERVVGELVSNAIKYTPQNGKITVSLQQSEDTVELSVKDSGIGMTEDECSKIFDRFYRTQASQTMAKGSGLGLSIAKELVEMHDGTLSVTSRKGAGATFTMRLPKHSAQGEDHA